MDLTFPLIYRPKDDRYCSICQEVFTVTITIQKKKKNSNFKDDIKKEVTIFTITAQNEQHCFLCSKKSVF